MIQVSLKENHFPLIPLAREELRRIVKHVLDFLDLSQVDLEIKLTNDQEIARLNKDFLNLNGPTNVLSFPTDNENEAVLNGYICLSTETLFREAFLYGQNPGQHMIRILIHGILHLLGYEHGPEMEITSDQARKGVYSVFADQFP